MVRKVIFVTSDKTFPLKLKGKVSVRLVLLCVTVYCCGTVGTDLGDNEPVLGSPGEWAGNGA